MATNIDIKAIIAGKRIPIHLKVDWLAFTISEEEDKLKDCEFLWLKKLGYALEDFENVSGKNFLNSGKSLDGGAVRVFYNDRSLPVMKGTSSIHNYIFSGVGCTGLQQHLERLNKTWVDLFKDLSKTKTWRIKRLDLAGDDWNYKPFLSFDYIDRKIAKKEYVSKNRRFNTITDFDTNGKLIGKTQYFGSRSSGSAGFVLCRTYLKSAQMLYAKKQVDALPIEVLLQSKRPDFEDYSWIRWELEITKHKAEEMVKLILKKSKTSKNALAEAYYEVLKGVIDFKVPTKNQHGEIYKNKTKWRTSPKYELLLNNIKNKAVLENADKIYDLDSVLRWIRFSCLPTLQMVQEIMKRFGYDFYDTLRSLDQAEYSKKQLKLLRETQSMTQRELEFYMKHFKMGDYE